MSQTITVGKKRNVTFVPLDQNNNPNPVGPDGLPLQVKPGTIVWSLEPLIAQPLRGVREATDGFTLAPSADGANCDVTATVAGIVQALVCTADRGDGVLVTGAAAIEAVAAGGGGPTTVIASLSLQFGVEQ